MTDNHLQQLREQLDQILTHFDVDMCAAYALDDALGDRQASHDAIMAARTRAMQAITSTIEAEVVRELKDLLSSVPMPTLSYEQIEQRIAALQATQQQEKESKP